MSAGGKYGPTGVPGGGPETAQRRADQADNLAGVPRPRGDEHPELAQLIANHTGHDRLQHTAGADLLLIDVPVNRAGRERHQHRPAPIPLGAAHDLGHRHGGVRRHVAQPHHLQTIECESSVYSRSLTLLVVAAERRARRCARARRPPGRRRGFERGAARCETAHPGTLARRRGQRQRAGCPPPQHPEVRDAEVPVVRGRRRFASRPVLPSVRDRRAVRGDPAAGVRVDLVAGVGRAVLRRADPPPICFPDEEQPEPYGIRLTPHRIWAPSGWTRASPTRASSTHGMRRRIPSAHPARR